jgi:hypothetical protein
MREKFCFWSIATGSSRDRAQRLVDSARLVGVLKDFHIWTNSSVEGAICHPLSKSKARERFVQLSLLEQEVGKLKYDYFVWLDANTFFVRHPGDVLRVLQGAPVHASLESDAALPEPAHPDWGICSLSNFTKLMRFCGVRSRAIFTVNAGFWIVHRDVIDTFCGLAWVFCNFCKKVGYRFEFEPLLAYATQMLCGNPYAHTLKRTADLWAPEPTAIDGGKCARGGCWDYVDYFSGETFKIKPAIVRAMQSNHELITGAQIPGRRSAAY